MALQTTTDKLNAAIESAYAAASNPPAGMSFWGFQNNARGEPEAVFMPTADLQRRQGYTDADISNVPLPGYREYAYVDGDPAKGAYQWVPEDFASSAGTPAITIGPGGGQTLEQMMSTFMADNAVKQNQTLAASQDELDAKAKAKHSAFKKGLLSTLGAGFAALAAPAIIGGVGAGAAAAPTAATSSGAASGGLGSLFSNFSTSGALKGALGSGLSGLVSGDGIGGALRGAAIGGITGGIAPGISNATGLGGTASGKALEGAITGGASGYASGGAKNGLLGGLASAAGNYIMSGGNIPGLGSVSQSYPDLTEAQNAGKQALLGTGGNGILGTVSRGINSLGLSGGGNSSMLGGLGSAISGVTGFGALNDAEDDIIAAQRQAAAQLQPYQSAGNNALSQLTSNLSAGFDPSSIENDKGYQFNVGQANKALDRASSARGNFYSGAALKDAAKYGSDIANTYANDYFNRWNTQNNQLAGLANTGYNASSNIGNILAEIGGTKANANVGRNNLLSQILASFL